MSGIELLERVIKHIWNRVACGIKLQNAYGGGFPIRDIYQLPLGKFLLVIRHKQIQVLCITYIS